MEDEVKDKVKVKVGVKVEVTVMVNHVVTETVDPHAIVVAQTTTVVHDHPGRPVNQRTTRTILTDHAVVHNAANHPEAPKSLQLLPPKSREMTGPS